MKTLSLRLCAFAGKKLLPASLPLPLPLLLLLLLFSPAFATRVERLIDTWSPTHYDVDIKLNEQLSEISASARISVKILKPTPQVDLDFGELTVDRVILNSAPISFIHKDGTLLVNLPKVARRGDSFVITVDYHGKPKDGLIISNDKDGKPSAVGDNWPNRVHHWIPSFDHPSAKATVNFKITAPATQEVTANGSLDHVETTATGERTWTFTEEAPIPPYCMVIAVGQFAKLGPLELALTPLSYYVPYSDRAEAVKGFGAAGPSVSFFSRTVAPYPYEKLALVVGATRFGGMENSGAIVFTSSLFNRRSSPVMSHKFGVPAGTVALIAHEIAHQWFGDSVTESTWSDLWLSEGFATYFAGLFVQRFDGDDAFQKYMKDASARVFDFEKKKLVPIVDRETEDLFALLNANNYQKGSWVLHMLRSNLGDEAFFRGIRNYYEAHKNSVATTDDLRVALEKASGQNLRPFFTRWVYDSGHPQYELSWFWLGQRETRLVLVQKQKGNVFVDPVPVTITTASGKRDVVIKPSGKLTIERVPMREQPIRVELDPHNVLLDEATVKKGK